MINDLLLALDAIVAIGRGAPPEKMAGDPLYMEACRVASAALKKAEEQGYYFPLFPAGSVMPAMPPPLSTLPCTAQRVCQVEVDTMAMPPPLSTLPCTCSWKHCSNLAAHINVPYCNRQAQTRAMHVQTGVIFPVCFDCAKFIQQQPDYVIHIGD